jgi:hypothetical protein
MGRYKIVRVPATTNNLTEGIINFLNSRGHFAFRVNNGAVYDPERQAFRRPAANAPAIADIHCTLYPSGLSCWIEVKNAATGDRVRGSKQKDFAAEIKKRGGFHYFAKTYDDFKRWYSTYIQFDAVIEKDAGLDT